MNFKRYLPYALAAVLLAGTGGVVATQTLKGDRADRPSGSETAERAGDAATPKSDALSPGTTPGPTPTGPVARDGPGETPVAGVPDNFVYAGYQNYGPDDPRPVACELKRGNLCTIQFHGTYRLTTASSGTILLGAYEDGSKEPAASTELAVQRGTARWFTALTYRVGDKASSVVFKAILLGPDRQMLFEPDPPPPSLPISA